MSENFQSNFLKKYSKGDLIEINVPSKNNHQYNISNDRIQHMNEENDDYISSYWDSKKEHYKRPNTSITITPLDAAKKKIKKQEKEINYLNEEISYLRKQLRREKEMRLKEKEKYNDYKNKFASAPNLLNKKYQEEQNILLNKLNNNNNNNNYNNNQNEDINIIRRHSSHQLKPDYKNKHKRIKSTEEIINNIMNSDDLDDIIDLNINNNNNNDKRDSNISNRSNNNIIMYDNNNENNNNSNKNLKRTNSIKKKKKKKSISKNCASCNSINDLEEDIDNPGTFYCQRCWEEYDEEMKNNQNKIDISMRRSREGKFKKNNINKFDNLIHRNMHIDIPNMNKTTDIRSNQFDDIDDSNNPRLLKTLSTQSSGSTYSTPKWGLATLHAIPLLPDKNYLETKIDESEYLDPLKFLKTKLVWVVHDNPQLGNTVNNLLQTKSSIGQSLYVLIETRPNKQTWKFIKAKILFSGRSHGEDDLNKYNEEDIINGNITEGLPSRGSCCLVLCNLEYYCLNELNAITKEKNGVTYIKLENDNKLFTPRSAKKRNANKISQKETIIQPHITEFLSDCHARIDIIFDPLLENGKWIPFKDGGRRFAPQFKSQGIGYIRLADDMGQNGIDFISKDGGETFLGSLSSTKRFSPIHHFNFKHNDNNSKLLKKKSSSHLRKNSNNNIQNESSPITENNFKALPASKYDSLLRSLLDDNLGWRDSVKTLEQIRGHLEAIGESFTPSEPQNQRFFSYIQDALSINKTNIHILREIIGVCIVLFNSLQNLFLNLSQARPILLALFKLLNHSNKIVSKNSLDALSTIHRYSNLSQVLPLIFSGNTNKNNKFSLLSHPAKAAPKHLINFLKFIENALDIEFKSDIDSSPQSTNIITPYINVTNRNNLILSTLFPALVNMIILSTQHRDKKVRDQGFICLKLLYHNLHELNRIYNIIYPRSRPSSRIDLNSNRLSLSPNNEDDDENEPKPRRRLNQVIRKIEEDTSEKVMKKLNI